MSFLGGVLGGIAGFVTGGPAGAAVGFIGGLRGGGGGMMMAPMPMAALPTFMPPSFPSRGGAQGMDLPPAMVTVPMQSDMMGMACPGGTACQGMSAGGLCFGACAPIGMMGRAGRCPLPAPRGFHWNQRTYCTLKQGVIPACTRVVKNRKLNPANGRAARRAVRRITATHKLLKRIEKSIRRIKGVRSAKIPRARGSTVRGREVAIVQ